MPTNQELENKIKEKNALIETQKEQIGELQEKLATVPDIEALKEEHASALAALDENHKEALAHASAQILGSLEESIDPLEALLRDEFGVEREMLPEGVTIFHRAIEFLKQGKEAENQLAMTGAFNVTIHDPMLMISLALHDVARTFDATFTAKADQALPEDGAFFEAAAERFSLNPELMGELVKQTNFGDTVQWLFQQLYNAIGPPPATVNTDPAEIEPPLPMTPGAPVPGIPGQIPAAPPAMMPPPVPGQPGIMPPPPAPVPTPTPTPGIAPQPLAVTNPAFQDPGIAAAIEYFSGYSTVHSQTLRAFITKRPEVIGGQGAARVPSVDEVQASINWCYANEVGTKPNATRLLTLLSYMTQGT